RGAPPDFTLPKPNPNPSRMTDALWWLVCMRELLEPDKSDNGGTFADKAGYHNAGENLPDHGAGNAKTDHSIRRTPDRSGPWWKKYSSAHDWTFRDAQAGNYATIDKYTTRLVNAMRDPNDFRPDDVYAYTLGQMDGDTVVEGYNEYTDMPETSADKTHNWHRHDSFRRNIIGLFSAMWKALTIDMGWTYEEWQRSISEEDDVATPEEIRANVVGGVFDFLKGARERTTPTGRQSGDLITALFVDPVVTRVTGALAALDSVDEVALAEALAPAVADSVLSRLPSGSDPVTKDELVEALTETARLAFAGPEEEPPPA
ncbi:MAG TPA: hypothetical protein VFP10_02125, partial [Candidatus Eisenbacteria bacterium]|nr:hypothetical protein [Candidatus Eisenbacteria bacterium]